MSHALLEVQQHLYTLVEIALEWGRTNPGQVRIFAHFISTKKPFVPGNIPSTHLTALSDGVRACMPHYARKWMYVVEQGVFFMSPKELKPSAPIYAAQDITQ